MQPGLNYHLPYPIETALTPRRCASTRSTSACARSRTCVAARTTRDVPEESLMLTGDENIVDVDFSVLWKVKPNGVGDYLFNIQNPKAQ